MLKFLLLFIATFAVAMATKEEEAACVKEVKVKMNSEADFSLKLSLSLGLLFEALGNENGLRTIYKGLTPERQLRVRNYYLIGACLPFQKKLDE